MLLAEYAAESGIPELGAAHAQVEIYRALEAGGVLHVLGAFRGDDLVGFAFVLVSVLPHFGQVVGTTESYFVTRDARKGGAGLALLRAAEKLSRERGAKAFMVSAPAESRLTCVMPGAGYRETNRVFFKALA
ncbi:GNAT family N-acetyltransferase [Ralstonia syzygii subsp. celebesensis]|uniref:GNAT family N-acetyltransferase n=1 Tax=Ralstonia syzygii TaxID=28097 RepID=UPI00191D8DDC|nr:GNAT family N-acetyltransferase [Ralstonia syzygii]QQV54340.1 GNAT family N-acetyltransferase [Ralstonia syzygii subsp. celebesensis]